jgi:hypothetical protein
MSIITLCSIAYNVIGGIGIALAISGQGAAWGVLAAVALASQFYPELVIRELFDESDDDQEESGQ